MSFPRVLNINENYCEGGACGLNSSLHIHFFIEKIPHIQQSVYMLTKSRNIFNTQIYLCTLGAQRPMALF